MSCWEVHTHTILAVCGEVGAKIGRVTKATTPPCPRRHSPLSPSSHTVTPLSLSTSLTGCSFYQVSSVNRPPTCLYTTPGTRGQLGTGWTGGIWEGWTISHDDIRIPSLPRHPVLLMASGTRGQDGATLMLIHPTFTLTAPEVHINNVYFYCPNVQAL